jgi:hypothetical protein
MPQDPRRHLAGSIAVIKAAVFEAREPELILIRRNPWPPKWDRTAEPNDEDSR